MSGIALLTLAETAVSAVSPGLDLPAMHAAVTAEVLAGLGPAHAALFARPTQEGDRITWKAPGAELRRFPDLDVSQRQALLVAAGSILSDIRRLGESGRAPAVARAWPALRCIAGMGALCAIDGRPVLAPWADGTDGRLLAAYDDGAPFVQQTRLSLTPYLVGLSCAALLALAAGPASAEVCDVDGP